MPAGISDCWVLEFWRLGFDYALMGSRMIARCRRSRWSAEFHSLMVIMMTSYVVTDCSVSVVHTKLIPSGFAPATSVKQTKDTSYNAVA